MIARILRLSAAALVFAVVCAIAWQNIGYSVPLLLCFFWALCAGAWGRALGAPGQDNTGRTVLGIFFSIGAGIAGGFLGVCVGLYTDLFTHPRLWSFGDFVGVVLMVILGAVGGGVVGPVGWTLLLAGFADMKDSRAGRARFRAGFPFWVRTATLAAALLGLLAELLAIRPILPVPAFLAPSGEASDVLVVGVVFALFVLLLVGGELLFLSARPNDARLGPRYAYAGLEGGTLAVIGFVIALSGFDAMGPWLKAHKFQLLIERLEKGDPGESAGAADDLGDLRAEADAAVPALARALHDKRAGRSLFFGAAQYPVGASAGKALTKIGTPAARNALKEALTDPEAQVRKLARQELAPQGQYGETVLPALTAALQSPDWETRRWAAVALKEIGTPAPSAMPALVEALRDQHSELRAAAAEALGLVGAPTQDAVPPLVAALGDDDPVVRKAAKAALDRIDPIGQAERAAVPIIQKLGGTVTRDETKPGKPIVAVSLADTPVTDTDLMEIRGLRNVMDLNLANTRITDLGLKHLKELTHLQTLNLLGTQVTEAGVVDLLQAVPGTIVKR